jgi:hypothetical protein
MERRIAEDRIELTLERKRFSISDTRIEAAGTRRGYLSGTTIDAHNGASGVYQALCEGPVPTAQIKHAFASLWSQQREDLLTQLGHESRVSGVRLRVPMLRDHSLFFVGSTTCRSAASGKFDTHATSTFRRSPAATACWAATQIPMYHAHPF